MREHGIGRITLLVFGAIFAALIYAGFKILPFFYYYLEMENQMQQVIRIASTTTDQEIRDKLLYHMHWSKLPADDKDLKIERIGQHMRISLPYSEVFYVEWNGKVYDLYVFEFNAFAEGDF